MRKARVRPLFVRAVAACACLAVLGLGGARARAATPSSEAEAEAAQTFREARALLDQGRHREACRLFEDSQRLDPSPGTLLNLGNCREQDRDLVAALAAFREALAQAEGEPDPTRRAGWSQAARTRIGELEPRIPTLRLRSSPTPGSRVALDGKAVEDVGAVLRLNPGSHHVEVSAPGHQAHSRALRLSEGQRREIALPSLVPIPAAASAPGLVEPPPPDAAPTRYGVLPWVLTGTGAALVAGALVPGLMAKGKESDNEALCGDLPCPSESESEVNRNNESGKRLALIADVAWIGGALIAGAGVTLFLLDGPSEDPGLELSAGCFAGGCRLGASGRF